MKKFIVDNLTYLICTTMSRASLIKSTSFDVLLFQRKCDRYWPKEDSETYGNIEASLLKEESMANYTVRTLKIKHLKVKQQL